MAASLLCWIAALLAVGRPALAESPPPPPSIYGGSEPGKYFPDMAALRDPDAARAAARVAKAQSQFGGIIPGANCTLPDAPCRRDMLTTWWANATHHQRSLLMMSLAQDGYPKPENLGADGDGPDHKCRLEAKWRWLGAEQVVFIDSTLTNIVLLKAGSTVFLNYRGTWTEVHNSDNFKNYALKSFDALGTGARAHGGWRDSQQQSWPQVVSAIKTDFGCGGFACKFVVTGHSRGGGLAALAAAKLAAEQPGLGSVVEVITFGGVRPGNRKFNQEWEKKFGAITTNWWNRLDWVPRQPFINPQTPRLRMTNSSCPTTTTTADCYRSPVVTKNGRTQNRRFCSGRTNTTAAAYDHLEYIYVSAIRNCTADLGMETACADWL
ncbi:MAG: Alpha/Beta hydrolase protein [Monoraphidium minutum]|nr:MAG: Alpha/Beta hydrolase protein [Monoraphidium minutum]